MRVLFVDDEPNVLEALQRMLRQHVPAWDLTFVASGQEALQLLGKMPHDVIVSDMRMPEMDGATLLAIVRDRHPSMLRIVLSGHSEKQLVLRSVGFAHQYLSKPCEPRQLVAAIERARSQRQLLADPRLRGLVASLQVLPSPPRLYAEMMALIQSPVASVSAVADLVARDPGMTAQILRIVNSAFFGLGREVSNPQAAIQFLGLETLCALAMSREVFRGIEHDTLEALGLQTLWDHSVETALRSRAIARAERVVGKAADECFTAGLVHDIGIVLLATNFPSDYRVALEAARARGATLEQAEADRFGATHAAAGAYLLDLWGLPQPIVEAVAFHHDPSQAPAAGFSPLTAVHVADALASSANTAAGLSRKAVDLDYLRAAGMADRLPGWRSAMAAA